MSKGGWGEEEGGRETRRIGNRRAGIFALVEPLEELDGLLRPHPLPSRAPPALESFSTPPPTLSEFLQMFCHPRHALFPRPFHSTFPLSPRRAVTLRSPLASHNNRPP